VVGDENSKILDKAIPISDYKLDKRGRPYHVVSLQYEKLLGISGSIQRSIPPRFIREKKFLINLMKILGRN
jgi:hypothetical protein